MGITRSRRTARYLRNDPDRPAMPPNLSVRTTRRAPRSHLGAFRPRGHDERAVNPVLTSGLRWVRTHTYTHVGATDRIRWARSTYLRGADPPDAVRVTRTGEP
ncbi:hypothetical protein GCM10009872_48760 [Actinopolymorpha rutila]